MNASLQPIAEQEIMADERIMKLQKQLRSLLQSIEKLEDTKVRGSDDERLQRALSLLSKMYQREHPLKRDDTDWLEIEFAKMIGQDAVKNSIRTPQ